MSGRRRADAGAPAAPSEDSEALREWHRRQASQIELDLQQHGQAALELERDLAAADRVHYATLYEQAPAGYLSLDAEGRIVRLNQAAAELLAQRRDDLGGLPLERLVAGSARARLRQFVAALFAGGTRAVLELPLAAGHGRAGRPIRIEANFDAVAQRCRMILTDIGSAGRREAARQCAFEVLDHIGEGVLVCDSLQRIVMVNPAFTRLTGYPGEDALGRSPGFLLHAGSGGGEQHDAALQALRGGSRWQGELQGRRRDGSLYMAALSITAVYGEDGAAAYFIGVFSDISARHQAAAALRQLSDELDARVVARTAELAAANRSLLREVARHKRTAAQLQRSREQLGRLAAHQETVREEERRRIARDVHDELGQNLLALRIDVSHLQARAGAGRLRRRVDVALENLDSTIRSVRGIMNELRPAVLDLGLLAALEWQVQEFRRRSGLACTLLLPAEDDCAPIAPPMAVALFRCVQEALSNVRRHAAASRVAIALAVGGGRLTLSVADDGVGLAPGGAAARGGHDAFGLISMAQRVAALGGSMALDTPPAGRGCRLVLSFDL
ncbi:PAS domain-containing protein [Duganella sp.]|uniref:sensor histidine kinase n=1 Tax=Duganella sp. TaxID=1904440 RepID=UPI0031DB2AFF